MCYSHVKKIQYIQPNVNLPLKRGTQLSLISPDDNNKAVRFVAREIMASRTRTRMDGRFVVSDAIFWPADLAIEEGAATVRFSKSF